jgi:23S rRNA (adenine2503-C2)-methyltransferase
MAKQPVLYDLTHAELTALMAGWGEPSFRGEQIWRWLYKSLVSDIAGMANLPHELRSRLRSETRLDLLEPIAQQVSSTGQTHKVLFRLRDGSAIESVLMRYDDRRTACISTQVGCGMGCTFCATGQGGLARNLSAGEIVAQVLHFAREIRDAQVQEAQENGRRAALDAHPISNVVLMGMGEPLANYQATMQAIDALTDPRGYGLGARRITLSTVGLVPGIRRLARAAVPINLAVSLHAANDALRDSLVPVNRNFPLADLLAAVRDYVDAAGRRVTFEYALISGINDAPQQARELAALLEGLLCHVNLIPLNPTPDSPLRPSSRERVGAFRTELEKLGIPVTVRMRRGIEIEAGCGQLRQRQSRFGAR